MDAAFAKLAPRANIGTRYVILTGNPNCGKTTLFNALTGLRAKVGNYAGVTVERKEGRLSGSSKKDPTRILDLPGTYSLSPQSMDEQIARDILFHRLPEVPPPDLVVIVVDASNLQRNLYFATQVIELGYPTILALNMIDVAEQNGHRIDSQELSRLLGVPVCPIVASTGRGVDALKATILSGHEEQSPQVFCKFAQPFEEQVNELAGLLEETFPESQFQALAEARLILTDERFLSSSVGHYPQSIRTAVIKARARLENAGIDWRSIAIESRYSRIAEV